MTTHEDDKHVGRDRLINEDAIIRESKQFVMSGSYQRPEIKLMRGLLTIIDRLNRVDDPEYKRAIWGLREGE